MIHLLDPSITREQAHNLRKARTNHRITLAVKTLAFLTLIGAALAVIM